MAGFRLETVGRRREREKERTDGGRQRTDCRAALQGRNILFSWQALSKDDDRERREPREKKRDGQVFCSRIWRISRFYLFWLGSEAALGSHLSDPRSSAFICGEQGGYR